MTSKYQQVLISAESKSQAETILSSLLKKKLIVGGIILQGPAQWWWKGKIIKMRYAYIVGFTLNRLSRALIREAEKSSVEEVPMISLTPLEGNEKFLRWIETTLK